MNDPAAGIAKQLTYKVRCYLFPQSQRIQLAPARVLINVKRPYHKGTTHEPPVRNSVQISR
jgi:hypothetical protein